MSWKGSFKTCNINILTTQTEKQLGEVLQILNKQTNKIIINIIKIERFSLDENSFHCVLLWHFHYHLSTIFPSPSIIYHNGVTRDGIHRESCRLSQQKLLLDSNIAKVKGLLIFISTDNYFLVVAEQHAKVLLPGVTFLSLNLNFQRSLVVMGKVMRFVAKIFPSTNLNLLQLQECNSWTPNRHRCRYCYLTSENKLPWSPAFPLTRLFHVFLFRYQVKIVSSTKNVYGLEASGRDKAFTESK